MPPPTQGDNATRPLRQPPITRMNSPALAPSLSVLLTSPPSHEEQVQDWTALPFPYTVPFPSPLETDYALQPSTAEHINQLDHKWGRLQHHQFLDTLRERGEETHLDPVAVQTLSEIEHEFLRRKEKLAIHHRRPLEQQIPSATMMPNNMTRHRCLAQLQQEQRNAMLDEQVYRVMEGLSPPPPQNNFPPHISEEEQAQLLTEGVQLLPEGLVYQQMHNSSAFTQQGPDQYYAPPSPGHHESSSHVHVESYGENLGNADIQSSGSEHPLTMLTQLSPTLATQHPPTHIQPFNTVGKQASEYTNQHYFDSNAAITPQQTMRMGMGQSHQGFENAMMVSHEMAMPSASTAQAPGQIISGNNLQQYDERRQKERKTLELQQMSYIIAHVLKQQPSLDALRVWLHDKNISLPVRSMIWNQQALAQWRQQKHIEYLAETQEQGRSVHESNLTLSALFTIAQQRGRSVEWATDVARCASGHGWNIKLKREELTTIVQRVAEQAVLKDVSWDQICQFANRNHYSKYHFKELIAEMGRRGWNVQQKQAEVQQQQQLMRDPSVFTTQSQSLLPVQQPQQQPMQNTNQTQSTLRRQTMSPPQQAQSSFWSQTMSSPQQVQQRQRLMTPATMNGSSPQQQPYSHRQYNQNILYQQQAQNMGFLPTPSPGTSSGQIEAFQAQMQNGFYQGQGVPMYPNINFPSPYMSHTPDLESTASPRTPARKYTASTGNGTAKDKDNRYSKELELWEKQSGFLRSPSPSLGDSATPVCSPARSDTTRHQSGLTTKQQNHLETSMRKQQTVSQAQTAEGAARKQGQGQHRAQSGNESAQMQKADFTRGTYFDQSQANNTAPTARMLAKRPAEDQAEPDMPKGKRLTRGVREWKTG